MCSYHLNVSHVSTLACILSVFPECDIRGGDIKEVTCFAFREFSSLDIIPSEIFSRSSFNNY
jgi:hypothetical protein